MIGFQKTLPRVQRTPQYYYTNILGDLFQILAACAPEADRDILRWLVYQRGPLTALSGDEMGQYWRNENNGKLDLPHLAMIASAYCADAHNVMDRAEIAWLYLMEAQRHLGMCRAATAWRGQSDLVLEFVAREARAENARKSGVAKAKISQPAKDEAYRLIRERARDGTRWASSSEAARAIGPEIQAFLDTLQPRRRFTDSRISLWLRAMPEAEELFSLPSKKVNGC